jgi:hypothetical protein
MILAAKEGRIQRAEDSWNRVRITFFSSMLLSIFQQPWTKFLHLVQDGYTSSPGRGAQKWVTKLTGPFLAPLNIAFYYTFAIAFSIFKNYFKGTLKRVGFVHENWNFLCMHHILSQAILIKGVSEVFIMIPPNVGLWFTIDLYVHLLPLVWCALQVKFRFGLVSSNLGIDWVILSISWFLSHA